MDPLLPKAPKLRSKSRQPPRKSWLPRPLKLLTWVGLGYLALRSTKTGDDAPR